MREPILFSILVLLVSCPANRAADPDCSGGTVSSVSTGSANADGKTSSVSAVLDGKVVLDLFFIANDRNLLLEIRTNAIDMMGELKSGVAVPVLRKLLNDPHVESYQRNLFVWHVVRALGKIGPSAHASLPDLAKAKGKDYCLNQSITFAETSIWPAYAQTPAAPASSKPYAKKSVSDLLALLKDNDPCVRLSAAKALGGQTSDADKILPALRTAMENDDPDVRRMAAISTKKILYASKSDKATYDNWANQYVNGLASMFGKGTNDAQERLFAVKSLSELDPPASCVPTVFLNGALNDKDGDVKSVAKNWIDRIQNPGDKTKNNSTSQSEAKPSPPSRSENQSEAKPSR